MALTPKTFSEAFTFSRARTAPYKDAAGVTQTAAIDTPRFDFNAGLPRGLLIEGQPTGEPDILGMRPGTWSAQGGGTVLHDLDAGAGVEHRALYASSPAEGISSALRTIGRHRRVRFVAEFLEADEDGVITFDGTAYQLPIGEIDMGGGNALDLGGGVPLTVD